MIIQPEQLPDIRERHPDEVIVYACGCFDILHPGHLKQLEYVKSLGDIAVIGVTPDVRVRAKKGPTRPINTQEARVTMINALRPVDYAFVTPAETMPGFKFIGQGVVSLLKPNIYVTHDPSWLADETLAEQGIAVVPGPELIDGASTTAIINKIMGGQQAS